MSREEWEIQHHVLSRGRGRRGVGRGGEKGKKKTPHTAQYFPCAAAEEEIGSICYVQSRVSAQRPGKEGSLFPRWGGGAAGGSAEGRKVPPTAMRDRDGGGGEGGELSWGRQVYAGRGGSAGGALSEEGRSRRYLGFAEERGQIFRLCPWGGSPREEAAGAVRAPLLLPALPAPGTAGDRLLTQHPVLLLELQCQLCPPPRGVRCTLRHPSKQEQGEMRANFPPLCLPLSSSGWGGTKATMSPTPLVTATETCAYTGVLLACCGSNLLLGPIPSLGLLLSHP